MINLNRFSITLIIVLIIVVVGTIVYGSNLPNYKLASSIRYGVVDIPNTSLICNATYYSDGFYYCNIDDVTRVK